VTRTKRAVTTNPERDAREHVRAIAYVYDGDSAGPTVESVLDRLAERPEQPRVVDTAAGDPADARREAMLVVRGAVRVGTTPDELFDEAGDPDFSAGALVTEAETGRRRLHVGDAALEALKPRELNGGDG